MICNLFILNMTSENNFIEQMNNLSVDKYGDNKQNKHVNVETDDDSDSLIDLVDDLRDKSCENFNMLSTNDDVDCSILFYKESLYNLMTKWLYKLKETKLSQNEYETFSNESENMYNIFKHKLNSISDDNSIEMIFLCDQISEIIEKCNN